MLIQWVVSARRKELVGIAACWGHGWQSGSAAAWSVNAAAAARPQHAGGRRDGDLAAAVRLFRPWHGLPHPQERQAPHGRGGQRCSNGAQSHDERHVSCRAPERGMETARAPAGAAFRCRGRACLQRGWPRHGPLRQAIIQDRSKPRPRESVCSHCRSPVHPAPSQPGPVARDCRQGSVLGRRSGGHVRNRERRRAATQDPSQTAAWLRQDSSRPPPPPPSLSRRSCRATRDCSPTPRPLRSQAHTHTRTSCG